MRPLIIFQLSGCANINLICNKRITVRDATTSGGVRRRYVSLTGTSVRDIRKSTYFVMLECAKENYFPRGISRGKLAGCQHKIWMEKPTLLSWSVIFFFVFIFNVFITLRIVYFTSIEASRGLWTKTIFLTFESQPSVNRQ